MTTISEKQKILKLCFGKVLASGWTGWYFRLNAKIGLKVIPRHSILQHEAIRLRRWNKQHPGLFPNFYGIQSVSICGKRFKGILCEHIAGISGWALTKRQFKTKILPKLPPALVKQWSDCYRGNIILCGKKIRCIDAGKKFKRSQLKPFWTYR